MDIRIFPSRLSGILPAVSSKSYAHRALICAALSDRETVLLMDSTSEDIETTAGCLRALGAKIRTETPGTVRISPVSRVSNTPILDCGESGSTLRFLLPVASALCERVTFTGKGRLPERPIAPLTAALAAHGCRFNSRKLPLTVEGKIRGEGFSLPGDISSQFISGILLALPLMGGGQISLTTPLQSAAYVDMTIDTMKSFQVEVSRPQNGFSVEKNTWYVTTGDFAVEGDWSNAAFWLAAGALSGGISLTGLAPGSSQGDRGIISSLRAFGAEVSEADGKISASPGAARAPQVIDASGIPDLVPVLAVMASGVKGKTVIKNAARLRLKESDRLKTIAKGLGDLGGDIKETADGLVIRGCGKLKGGRADGANDHRIVMALAVAAILCAEPVEITGSEAVAKSYPGFFEDFQKLGGRFEVI
jgi:3-phosphoshikimate 1-carboxyvinyltransferase